MKKIFVVTLVLILLMSGCGEKPDTDRNQTASGTSVTTSGSAANKQVADWEKYEENSIEKTKVPFILEKIDKHTVGLEMPGKLTFSSEMVQGDDGSYYYFREKNAKFVFYRDNQIKVCEMEKPKGSVRRFVKYKDCIYLEIIRKRHKTHNPWLAALHIKTGKLRYLQKFDLEDTPYITFYKNSYYLEDSNGIIRYDLNGKQRKKFQSGAWIGEIIDDKIYYTDCDHEPGGKTTIMRCNLDGSGKEVLFQYTRGEEESLWGRRLSYNVMTIYHDYIYMLDDYDMYGSFYRIPLHGGNIEKITGQSVKTFELVGEKIFFLDNIWENLYMIKEDLEDEEVNISEEHRVENFVNGHDSVYFVDKESHGVYKTPIEQSASPVQVADITAKQLLFSDGNLIVKKYMKEDEEEINQLYKEEIDVNPDYAPEYCWINSEGEIIGTLEGVPLNPEKYYYW